MLKELYFKDKQKGLSLVEWQKKGKPKIVKMKTEELWNNMSPEERVLNPILEHLSEKILLSNWNSLPEYVRNHLIILLS